MRCGPIGCLLAACCLFACLLGGSSARAQTPLPMKPGGIIDRQAIFMNADRHTFGSPARADLGDVARLRLLDLLYYLPDRDAAEQVLEVIGIPIPKYLLGLIRAPLPSGANLWGTVEYVPSASIDADDLQSWSAADLLASIDSTIAAQNKQYPQLPTEVRGWIEPPSYDAKAHQVIWAALILPKGAPKNSSGEITFNAVAFGRDGFIRVTVFANTEQSATAVAMLKVFLAGLTFNPGKGYDALAAKTHDTKGLAEALRVNELHRAPIQVVPSAFADKVVPVVGAGIAAFALLVLAVWGYRYRRRNARRW
ncbi:MAG TPA: DUF2167 domain-containing protein [Rhodopila sp.]|jgi:uncharacterized membrane-anchored protein|nr:DUF2167 domain-containing protein [Rhodopila sp.]